MAYALATFDRYIIVHTTRCTTLSSVTRTIHRGSIVEVGDGLDVRLCSKCEPDVYVVARSSARIHNGARVEHLVEHYRRRTRRPLNPPTVAESHHGAGWELRGLCRGDVADPEDDRLQRWLWWLWQDDHPETWVSGVQKQVCADCPVRGECLLQGVWGMESWGVWGGATVEERLELWWDWTNEGRVDEQVGRSVSEVPFGGVRNRKRRRVLMSA